MEELGHGVGLQIVSDGDVLLGLTLEVEGSVKVALPVRKVSEAELQDYIDGAGTYLLQKVRLLDREDESAAPVLATRIRMPTPPQLRRHAEADDGSDAQRLPLLLAFDPDAVTARGAPALQLPPRIGDIVFVSESPDGSRLSRPSSNSTETSPAVSSATSWQRRTKPNRSHPAHS